MNGILDYCIVSGNLTCILMDYCIVYYQKYVEANRLPCYFLQYYYDTSQISDMLEGYCITFSQKLFDFLFVVTLLLFNKQRSPKNQKLKKLQVSQDRKYLLALILLKSIGKSSGVRDPRDLWESSRLGRVRSADLFPSPIPPRVSMLKCS